MEFCVGDRVLVRSNLGNRRADVGHCVCVNEDMLHFIGKQYIIIDVKEAYGEKVYKLGSRWGTYWWFVSDWLLPASGRVDIY